MRKTIVLSVGGSTVVPEEIDVSYLKKLKQVILSYLDKYKFIIVIGGGKTARKYQGGGKLLDFNQDSLDWIGVYSTMLNANLVRLMFGSYAYKEIISNPTKKVRFKDILVASGWKPGWSTDYDAVLLAKGYKARTVINVTNIDYLYTKDPRKFSDAKKIKKIDWKGFREIVGDKWKPGMNTIFDPVAAKTAAKVGLRLISVEKNLDNFKKFLDGKKFRGSVVEG